jgi:tetratricopeptide (TPR) repeat protein
VKRWNEALLAGALAMAAASAGAQQRCSLKQMEIPVRLVDQRPVATLKLNGVDIPMLVDSGAFFSMLADSTAEQLKLRQRYLHNYRIDGYTGKIEAKVAYVAKVGLLGAELSNVEFLVGGNELNAGIKGILGRNILSAGDAEYDLAHGVVRLSFPQGDCAKTNFAYWAGNAPVIEAPLAWEHDKDTAIRVHVRINGTRALALLDTGAPWTTMTLATARRAGLKEGDLKPWGRTGGAGRGRARTFLGNVASFELGGEKIANNELRIDELDFSHQDVLVGLDYFLSHRIYVSHLQNKIYATWNGNTVFARNRGGAAEERDTRHAALPEAPDKDDADALARRGAASLVAGNPARALEDLNRACELAPHVAENFATRARVHFAMRQPRLALADLDEALRLDPALAEARLSRAVAREMQGDRPGAQADLAQLDAALPPGSNLRSDMAELYARFPQVPEALKQYELWINSHPRDAHLASILNGRCWLRTRLNIDLSMALKDCRQAVSEDGGEAAFHDSLGWTYLRMDDLTRAKSAFDQAIKLQPLPLSLYGRALVQLRLKETTAGERDLAEARKLDAKVDENVLKQGFEFAESVARPKLAGN